MPLRNDLLNPISADKPSGENLRLSPVYDKIKEARRQDDDLAQGEWVRERKVADWPLVIKLISETLATKTKDLQLVAWLSEAMLRREGIGGFREVLELSKALLEKFWETLYPELEEGDAELRALPLQWMGDRLELAVKQLPLTKKGLNWYQYKESRAIGDEKSVAGNNEKKKERDAAIKAGKTPLEVFDKDFDETPKKYYVDLLAAYDATLESLTSLSELGDSKFGGNTPTYGTLRNALEEVRQTIYILLQKKREKEPDAPPPPTPEELAAAAAKAASAPAPVAAAAAPAAAAPAAAAAAAPAPALAKPALTADPANKEDAVERLVAVARFLRQAEKTSPAAYLTTAGFRWGELRAKGANIDAALLAAPPAEAPQNLKKLAMENKWAEVLEGGASGGRARMRPRLAGCTPLYRARLRKVGRAVSTAETGGDFGGARIAGGLSEAAGNDAAGRPRQRPTRRRWTG